MNHREFTFQEISEIILLKFKIIFLAMSIGLIVSFGYVHFYPTTFTNNYIQSVKISLIDYDDSIIDILKSSLTSDSWKKSLIEGASFDQSSYSQALIAISNAVVSGPNYYMEISIPSKKDNLEKTNVLLTLLSKQFLKVLSSSFPTKSKTIDLQTLRNNLFIEELEKINAHLKNLANNSISPERDVIIYTQYLKTIEMIENAKQVEFKLKEKKFVLSNTQQISDIKSTMIKGRNPLVIYLAGAFFGFILGVFGVLYNEERKMKEQS